MGRIAVQWLAALFLLGNLVLRLPLLHNSGLDVPAILLGGGMLFLFFQYRPGLLQHLCLLLGLSFPLYCYQSYTTNSQVFEFLAVLFGLLLSLQALRKGGKRKVDTDIVFLLTCCLLLAFSSLLLLPLTSIFRLLSLWGAFDFSSAVLAATPDVPLYPLAAANRLLLFFFVILFLSHQEDAPVLYRKLFQGAAAAGLLAALLGVLNQTTSLDLGWLRPQFLDPSGVPRLHSVTGNPGWFALYLLGTLPFVLLLLPRRQSRFLRYLMLAGVFLVSGLALLLTASRTSWLLFPVIAVLLLLGLRRLCRQEAVPAKGAFRRSAAAAISSVLLLCLLAAGLMYGVGGRENLGSGGGETARMQYIMRRLRHIVTPGERLRVWRESLVLAGESPGFGLGYEGYKWHQKVMTSIPESRFARNRKTANNWDTPHNFYLQLVISNGLAGLVLWGLMLCFVFRNLWLGCRYEGSSPAMSSLLSLVALLLYGLTQSIQYIPLIWYLFFLSIGYAMTVEQGNVYRHRFRPVLYPAVLLLLGIGIMAYLSNVQSRRLAERYGVERYATQRGAIRYVGFYGREEWGRQGVFRWSGPRAEIRLPYAGMVGFTLACNAPGLALDPMVLDVTLNGRPIDRYTFWDTRKVYRRYLLPALDSGTANLLQFTVSRTWTPRRAGMSGDRRDLGVAVSAPRLLGTAAGQEAGFSWVQVAEEGDGRPMLYRWTNRSAVLDPAPNVTDRLRLLLLGERPYLDRKPLVVDFIQDNRRLAAIQIAESGWKEITLPEGLRRDRPLVLLVDRTWNPRKEGYGDDGRDLGVAVTPLSSAAGEGF